MFLIKQHSFDELEEKAQRIFENDSRVIFAYLFGSLAQKRFGPQSDIDLAVFLREEQRADRRFGQRLDLIGKLQGPRRSSPFVDLVVLNKSPLFLTFNIIREGKLLTCRDQKKRMAFELRVMSRFYDEQYYFKRHAEATIHRIARRGIL